jgi:zinc/manganese transport system substrate-binding protein
MRLYAALLSIFALVSVSAATQDAPLKIVASFSILADVVQNVAGDHAIVTSLVPVGADPHSFEPSAQDIAALHEADIIFVAGGGFEETMLNSVSGLAGAVIVEASACVPMRALGDEIAGDGVHGEIEHEMTREDVLGRDLRTVCSGYDAFLAEFDAQRVSDGFTTVRVADVETLGPMFMAHCGHYDPFYDVAGGDHDHGACDPHVWTDPRSVAYWILYIRDILSGVDPDNAAWYVANAEAYLYAIDDLVRVVFEPMLAEIPAERRMLLTSHDTLGYFAAAYGFEIAGVVLPGGSTLAEPSARDLAALIDLVRAENVTAIFAENTVSARVAEQVAAETGAQVYTLYSDSLSEPNGPASTYLDYLAYNFETIAAALTPQ